MASDSGFSRLVLASLLGCLLAHMLLAVLTGKEHELMEALLWRHLRGARPMAHHVPYGAPMMMAQAYGAPVAPHAYAYGPAPGTGYGALAPPPPYGAWDVHAQQHAHYDDRHHQPSYFEPVSAGAGPADYGAAFQHPEAGFERFEASAGGGVVTDSGATGSLQIADYADARLIAPAPLPAFGSDSDLGAPLSEVARGAGRLLPHAGA